MSLEIEGLRSSRKSQSSNNSLITQVDHGNNSDIVANISNSIYISFTASKTIFTITLLVVTILTSNVHKIVRH